MSKNPKIHLSGPITVQFTLFRQGLMQTESDGGQVFIGVVDGVFGVPPNGSVFQARVKLTVGASFIDDAYEVSVPPALAELGAREEVRNAAYQYVDVCMSSMVGRDWRRMTGLTASNNLIQMQGPPIVVNFPDTSAGW